MRDDMPRPDPYTFSTEGEDYWDDYTRWDDFRDRLTDNWLGYVVSSTFGAAIAVLTHVLRLW